MPKKNEVKIRISAESSKARQEINETTSSLDKLGNEAEQSASKLKGFAIGTVLFNELAEAAQRLSSLVESVTDLSDAYRLLESRISNAVGSQEEAARIMGEIEAIAQRTHAPLQSVGELYARLRQNIDQTSASNEELLKFTEAVGNAMRVSGTSATEASGALLQLSQALASGTLRGDEFNSVNEQMPVIMSAVAKQLGVTKGELRGLAETGKITADVVKEAVLNMADDWQRAAENMPVTLKQALADLESAWQSYLGRSEGVGEATEVITKAIKELADHLGDLIDVASDAALAAMPALLIKISQSIAAYIVKLKEYAAAQREAAISAETSAAAEAAAAKEAALAQQVLAKARLHVAQTAVAAKSAALEAAKAAEAEALANQQAAAEVKLYGQQRVVIEREAAAAIQARKAAEQELALATEQAAIAQRNYTAAVEATQAAEAGRLGVLARLKSGMKGLLNPMNALNAGMSAWMGWEIGKWARENFTWVRKGAVLALAGVMSLKEGVVLLGEAFAALFTSDTVSAAYDRFNERMDEVRQNISGMLDDIDKGIDLQNEHAGSLKNMGDQAAEAGAKLDSLKNSLAGVNEELPKLTAWEAEAAASWIAIIDGATNAKEALERTQWAMSQMGDKTAAAIAINEAYQRSIKRVGSASDEAAAASARLAASWITQIQKAKSLEEAGRIAAQAMRELKDNTEAQALVSEALAEKSKSQSASLNEVADSTEGLATAEKKRQQQTAKSVERQKIFNEVLTETMTIGQKMAKHLEFWQQQMDGLSEAARAQFDSMVDTINQLNGAFPISLGTATNAVRDHSAEIRELERSYFHMREVARTAASDVTRWMAGIEAAGLLVKQEFLRQEDAAARLEQRLRSTRTLTDAQVESLRQAIASYNLLDQTRLDGLRQQVESLRAATEALEQSAQRTLASLQDELDRMQGDLVAIENRRYQQKQIELQEQLNKAREAGDQRAIAALQESLRLLEEIHRRKLEQLQDEQSGKTSLPQARSAATRVQAPLPAPADSRPEIHGSVAGFTRQQPAAAAASRHVIELRDSRGHSTEIDVADDQQAAKFIEALEQAGMVST